MTDRRTACREMFSGRLLRKAYRPDRRHGQCPADVYTCENEFNELVKKAEEIQPMDRGEWHKLCNEFSDKWEHICHWVHPSRLADFLPEDLEWVGEYPRPDAAQKVKIKSNVKAQRFKCPECDVACNSFSQYVIHSQGTKHQEALELKIQSEAYAGRTYTSPGAVPLDTNDQPLGVLQQPQAYFRKESSAEGSSSGACSTSTTPRSKASTPPPAYVPDVPRERAEPTSRAKKAGSMTINARIAAVTALVAFSMPLNGEFHPKQTVDKTFTHDPYSFSGGYDGWEQTQYYRQQPQGRQQQQQQQQQHIYTRYSQDQQSAIQGNEADYSGYSHTGYDSGYSGYDQYDYNEYYYNEPTFGGQRNGQWGNEKQYDGPFLVNSVSEDGTKRSEDDEDEDEEKEKDGSRKKRNITRARKSMCIRSASPQHAECYGDFERAWTSPSGPAGSDSDYDYVTDCDDQSSNSAQCSTHRRHTGSLPTTPSHTFSKPLKGLDDSNSLKTSSSYQDFETASASSEGHGSEWITRKPLQRTRSMIVSRTHTPEEFSLEFLNRDDMPLP